MFFSTFSDCSALICFFFLFSPSSPPHVPIARITVWHLGFPFLRWWCSAYVNSVDLAEVLLILYPLAHVYRCIALLQRNGICRKCADVGVFSLFILHMRCASSLSPCEKVRNYNSWFLGLRFMLPLSCRLWVFGGRTVCHAGGRCEGKVAWSSHCRQEAKTHRNLVIYAHNPRCTKAETGGPL